MIRRSMENLIVAAAELAVALLFRYFPEDLDDDPNDPNVA